MATQGLVSVVDHAGTVIAKAIAGCNGYNAIRLADEIKYAKLATAAEIRQAAITLNFGCGDCLVVLDEHTALAPEGNLPSAYRATFHDPRWNPRSSRGTAEHTEVITLTE